MHIDALHRSYAAPVRFRCMRRTLLPLTIGHVETMERMDCLTPTGAADLGTAVLICSQPWRDWPRFSTSRWLPAGLAIWRAMLGDWDVIAEMGRFHAYLEHEMSGPALAPRFGSTPGPASAIPFSRWITVLLCSRLGHDPATVRDYGVRDALWDHAALAEMDGRATVEALPYDERVAAMEAGLPTDEVMVAMATAEHAAEVEAAKEKAA